MSDMPVDPAGEGTSEAASPSLRYVVAGVCRFDFVVDPTPGQKEEIPLMIAKAVSEVVEEYSRRNVRGTSVEFVSVTEI
jgi:hypothetical protein